MAFALPTAVQLKDIAAELGIPTDDAYIAAVRAYMAPFVDAYELVGHIPSELPDVKYPRTPGYRPEGEENNYAAWIVKTSIKGAARGPLKGKKVAIKDTVCIAGVPLANGTSVLDG
ncbi:MAG TPA: amidase, partial [Alphaproteobacteria bacterium]|nr:amidase [Alphaproteobacteria bacterium]